MPELLGVEVEPKRLKVVQGLHHQQYPRSWRLKHFGDLSWASVKELDLGYYEKETPLFTIAPSSGNLNQVP